jgi:hypothetical protein
MSVLHCNENPIYVFLFWELHDLSPNFLLLVKIFIDFWIRLHIYAKYIQRTVDSKNDAHICKKESELIQKDRSE